MARGRGAPRTSGGCWSACAAPTGAHSATTSPCGERPRALPRAPPSARPSRVASATRPWPISRLL